MKTLKFGDVVVNLRPYTLWPVRGNAEAEFTVELDGKMLPLSDVRKTGGGIHPRYTYLKLDGKTFFANIDLPAGAKVTVAEKVVAAKPAAVLKGVDPEATLVPEAPKLTKKQLRAQAAAAKLVAKA